MEEKTREKDIIQRKDTAYSGSNNAKINKRKGKVDTASKKAPSMSHVQQFCYQLPVSLFEKKKLKR